MSHVFKIVEHTFDGQTIRNYPGGSINDQVPTRLCVKQYSPWDNLKPVAGDVTIIAATANALVKEVYEPLFESLVLSSQNSSWKVRSIWIADAANQGASGVANGDNVGNDPSAFDLSRDLLQMINLFRDQIQPPIFGFGHSLGASSLLFLSTMHPRLLACLALVEPNICQHRTKDYYRSIKFAASKRDRWPSREEAEKAITHSRFYSRWDPRALQLFLRFGVRSFTSVRSGSGKTVLANTASQELFSLARPNFENLSKNGDLLSITERETHPDLNPRLSLRDPFYRPETRESFRIVPFIRPPVLFVHGTTSTFLSKEEQDALLTITGTGVGGSGGRPLGQVEAAYVDGGHFVPVENVSDTATSISAFYDREALAWKVREERWRQRIAGKSLQQRQTADEEYLAYAMQIKRSSKL